MIVFVAVVSMLYLKLLNIVFLIPIDDDSWVFRKKEKELLLLSCSNASIFTIFFCVINISLKNYSPERICLKKRHLGRLAHPFGNVLISALTRNLARALSRETRQRPIAQRQRLTHIVEVNSDLAHDKINYN